MHNEFGDKDFKVNDVTISFWNRRMSVVALICLALIYIVGILVCGLLMDESAYAVDYASKLEAPSAEHIFGTDFMGRDMLARSVKGLSTSLVVGVLSAAFSSIIALVLGVVSAIFGGFADKFVNWAVDLCMGLPHIVLLILISFMLGRGTQGVVLAVIFTHWPGLTRIVRAEVMQVRNSQYVQAAYKMGMSKTRVAFTHIVPHVLPSYLIGLVLLFPHAIMHEAALTFLGFGLPKEVPSIGGILSESMNYLATGNWWLALFPGVLLLIAVIFFDVIGENLKKLWNPDSGNE